MSLYHLVRLLTGFRKGAARRGLGRRSHSRASRYYRSAVRLESLEARNLLSALGPEQHRLPDNVDFHLATYYYQAAAEGLLTSPKRERDAWPYESSSGDKSPIAREQRAEMQYFARLMQEPPGATSLVAGRELPHKAADLLQIDERGRVLVDVWATSLTAPVVSGLLAEGAEVLDADVEYRLVEAWLDVASLANVSQMSGVLSVTPVFRPLSRAGSVQTQGDAVIRADRLRDLGYDGSPGLVGVLSDSAYRVANSQTTGDLPPVVDRYLEYPFYDEGRAMLEIVHDIAPGAALAFHSGAQSELSFAQGIRDLAAAGASVICDDLIYFNEPFFQDGIVAQAVEEVANSFGVTYVSAAGNAADRSYESAFVDAGGLSAGGHDFDPGPAVDLRQRITLPPVPYGYYRPQALVLQWDQPFYTTDGVKSDFDIFLYGTDGTTLITSSQTRNLSTQQPLEVLSWRQYSDSDTTIDLAIRFVEGDSNARLKYVFFDPSATIDEYATDSPTIFGHPAATAAIAVGAVPFYDPNRIEEFSSVGDVTIFFDGDGNRLPTPELRPKPDLVAPDNVNTTFFGRDIPQDADTFPNFAGTSAAAPHVAGVASLIRDVNPHLTRTELYEVLTSTATDLGESGRDPIFGHGLVNADAARIAALAVVDVTNPVAALVSPSNVSGWDVQWIRVRFSEPMDIPAAADSSNYRLLEAGVDQLLDTPDDVEYTVAASYSDEARETTLTFVDPNTTLSDGVYRLTLDGANGLRDSAGNPINSGADQHIALTVGHRSEIASLEGGSQLGVRPDGGVVLVYPENASLNQTGWPQVMIGRFDGNGVSEGPYRSIPVDILDSYGVSEPDVAVNSNGGVLAYLQHQSRSEEWIGYQQFDVEGRAVGGNRKVASVDDLDAVRVDMNSSGAFAVAFSDYDSSYEHWAYGRLFQADGSPVGSAFRVSETTIAKSQLSVALADDGPSTFVFRGSDDQGILARRYDAFGTPLGPAFAVASHQTSEQSDPDLAAAADGSFVVVWKGQGQNDSVGVFMRRYDARGHAPAPDFQVAAGDLDDPQIGMAPDGRFVIVWRGADGSLGGLFAQRFTADGASYGNPLWVNQGLTEDEREPLVGMADNGDFVVSWQDSSQTRGRWFSWAGEDEAFPFGPWVRSLEPSSPQPGPISSFSVTFNRRIDPATFTVADLTVIDPAGRSVPSTSVVSVDDQMFLVTFDPQVLAGEYRIRIGPSISDTAGYAMNQDGDAVNGEPSDAFRGSVAIKNQPAPPPLAEGFEAGSIDDLESYWSFAATSGTVAVTDADAPHDGAYHLRMGGGTPNTTTYREAVLTLDLTSQQGRNDLALDLWVKRLNRSEASNSLALSVSGDRINWTSVVTVDSSAPLGQYLHYSFDLDAILAGAGIASDNDVYLSFKHRGYYLGSTVLIDDVRVSNAPTVTALERDGGTEQYHRLTSLRFVFSESVALSPGAPILELTNLATGVTDSVYADGFSSDTNAISWSCDLQPLALAPAYYQARLFAAGITNTVGVQLDGDFSGAFPSGDGAPGGDYVVRGDQNPKLGLVTYPGDADLDGTVGPTDLSALAAHWGRLGAWQDGDFSGDETVGPLDLSALAAHWGKNVPRPLAPLRFERSTSPSARLQFALGPTGIGQYPLQPASASFVSSPFPETAGASNAVPGQWRQAELEITKRGDRGRVDAVHHSLGVSLIATSDEVETAWTGQRRSQPRREDEGNDVTEWLEKLRTRLPTVRR